MDAPGEDVSDAGQVANRLRRANLPVTVVADMRVAPLVPFMRNRERLLRLLDRLPGDGQVTDVVEIRREDLGLSSKQLL